ncbi:MAG: FAD-binding protein, partial [Candidatus Cloacimonetes bacterium]|nr:FAD-binding protein [Candidatus Cloacimonadota bacterium]
LGTKFTRKNKLENRCLENLALTREGGHSQERVAHAADSTGYEIIDALIKSCLTNERITIFEDHIAVDLITQHHIQQDSEFFPGVSCWGAYALDLKTLEVHRFIAGKTMLATGGGAQVYANNTNPEVATGDGFAMAKRAGARLVNMEFVQFHPTAFYSPEGKTFLITEALRGEGAVLRLHNGDEFMKRYHPRECLAPRDVVSRALAFEMKKHSSTHLWLDATCISQEKLLEHFPYINQKLQKRGIDFRKDMIPVVPSAHYFCGGVLTTSQGKTDVLNLFASGEVACCGLHGANRLASNSLLEGIVISMRAATHPENMATTNFPEIPVWNDVDEFNEAEWVVIAHNKNSIKRIMQGYVGITRTRRLLKYAENRILNIRTEIENFYQHNRVRSEVIETRNLALTAQFIIRCALMRKESRGLHYLSDYPDRDEAYKKDTIL